MVLLTIWKLGRDENKTFFSYFKQTCDQHAHERGVCLNLYTLSLENKFGAVYKFETVPMHRTKTLLLNWFVYVTVNHVNIIQYLGILSRFKMLQFFSRIHYESFNFDAGTIDVLKQTFLTVLGFFFSILKHCSGWLKIVLQLPTWHPFTPVNHLGKLTPLFFIASADAKATSLLSSLKCFRLFYFEAEPRQSLHKTKREKNIRGLCSETHRNIRILKLRGASSASKICVDRHCQMLFWFEIYSFTFKTYVFVRVTMRYL
jgi:hypothetical protein